MRVRTKYLALCAVGILLFSGTVQALDLGTNITIDDGVNQYRSDGWYGGTSNQSFAREDNEVEPGCIANQTWDLEGFFLNGSKLAMVGGYDFVNGGYGSGDLFFDVNGDYGVAKTAYAAGNAGVTEAFGYDYVVDLDFTDMTYTVYALNDGTITQTVWYGQNAGSNPWRYVSGGTYITAGTFSYYTALNDDEAGDLLGGAHNAVVFDIGFLAGQAFTSHFTMGCGNDNLMGQGVAPVPEPATMVLLGTGLIALGSLRRRSRSGK